MIVSLFALLSPHFNCFLSYASSSSSSILVFIRRRPIASIQPSQAFSPSSSSSSSSSSSRRCCCYYCCCWCLPSSIPFLVLLLLLLLLLLFLLLLLPFLALSFLRFNAEISCRRRLVSVPSSLLRVPFPNFIVCPSVCLSVFMCVPHISIPRHFLSTRLPTHDSTPFPDLELFPSRLPHTALSHFLTLSSFGSQALVRPRPNAAPRAPRERLEWPVLRLRLFSFLMHVTEVHKKKKRTSLRGTHARDLYAISALHARRWSMIHLLLLPTRKATTKTRGGGNTNNKKTKMQDEKR